MSLATSPPFATRRRTASASIALWLTLAFVVRLAYGVTSEFWGEDELQVYLIGLEFLATGVWPLYGPDVVYTQTQIPGGLQGLMIGGPLWVAPWPEAPYVLLNVLSFAALCLLAWYIGRRVPEFPRTLLWPWVLFSPWTLNMSTHIINSSYVLFGAVLFAVGAFELVPSLRRDLLPRPFAFFCLGFGLLWIFQFHLSALLLVPVAVGVIGLAGWGGLGWAALGGALAAVPLLPTVLADGLSSLVQPAGANMVFEPRNLLRVPQIAAQFFALATFEVARFLGASTDARLGFLTRFWWAAPFVLCAALIGVVQTATLVAGLFQRRPRAHDWPAVKRAIIVLLALLAASFVWSVRTPASHAFFLLLPVVMIYAAYVWAPWLQTRAGRAVAVVLLVSGGVTHVAIGWKNFTVHSLYTNRSAVVRAIAEKNHRLVGVRRPEIWRGGNR